MATPQFLSMAQYAAKHGVSKQLVHRWLSEGLIEGATQLGIGGAWIIPAKAKRPPNRPGGRPPKKSSD